MFFFCCSADRNVQTIFDVSHAPKRKVLQIEMARLVDKYKHCEGDTGAIEVQGKKDASGFCSLKVTFVLFAFFHNYESMLTSEGVILQTAGNVM